MGRCLLLLLLFLAQRGKAQGFLINEVSPDRPIGPGLSAGWVELYNASANALDPHGWVVVVNGSLHRIDTTCQVPPNRRFLLFANDGRGAFRIPRKGAALLMWPDATMMADHFSWPDLPDGVTYGRLSDGSMSHGYFTPGSPGEDNTTATAHRHRAAVPEVVWSDGTFKAEREAEDTWRYTTDGSVPGPDAPVLPAERTLGTSMPLRVRAYPSEGLPSADLVKFAPGTGLALVVDPQDLWDPERGIHVVGIADNFSRKGPAWQRWAWMHWPTAEEVIPCRLAIAGSGSRGLPKKNLKLRAGGTGTPFQLPDGGTWSEITLRADATPHAFLRNTLISEVALLAGARVDVVHGAVLPLHLNGRFWGAFRLLPPKDEEWFSSLAGGGSVEVVKGSRDTTNAHFNSWLEALHRGAPLAELERGADMASLIELACFDLWTGRPDHELNVLSWRPATANGRWRWVLYDMDLWALPADPTVVRMSTESAQGAPWLPALLAHPELRQRLLARMVELEATVLAPWRVKAHAERLVRQYGELMDRDRDRWQAEMEVPSAEDGLAQLSDHALRRGTLLQRQLAKATEQAPVQLQVEVSPPGAGILLLNGTPLSYGNDRITAFAGNRLRFSVQPAPGMEFVGWAGTGFEEAVLEVDPARTRKVKAQFRPVAVSGQYRLQQGGE